MKKKDRVRVWGRLGVVRQIGLTRVHIELIDDKPDPPKGYSAWWKHADVEPAQQTLELGSGST